MALIGEMQYLTIGDSTYSISVANKPSYSFAELTTHPNTINGYGITDAYTKTEIDNKISSVLRYKGTKSAVDNLPITGNTIGDVWHVVATSGEYAWDGTEWQELGTAITIPAATGSSKTNISISNHGTGTVIGVQSDTTSVYGVKSGSNSTTTASKVTLGSAISVPNVTSAGSASNWVFENITVPIKNTSSTTVPKAATSATTVPIKNASATSIPNVTSVGTAPSLTINSIDCDDITNWSAGSGSATLTMAVDSTDTKKLVISFSHTHTAPTLSYTARSVGSASNWNAGSTPTLGTEISIIGVQSTTTSVTGVSGSTTVTGVQSTTTTASHVKSGGNGTAPTLGTAISIPNVTGATDVTVPIRADSATTVPIKNANASTFVTGTTHTITDNGHTHTI